MPEKSNDKNCSAHEIKENFSKITELHRYLKTHKRDMILLGFNQQPDDTVEIPTYETLRLFLTRKIRQ